MNGVSNEIEEVTITSRSKKLTEQFGVLFPRDENDAAPSKIEKTLAFLQPYAFRYQKSELTRVT